MSKFVFLSQIPAISSETSSQSPPLAGIWIPISHWQREVGESVPALMAMASVKTIPEIRNAVVMSLVLIISEQTVNIQRLTGSSPQISCVK